MADPSALSPVKMALAEIRELRARLDAVTRDRSEPIAIVGLAGRFPGAEDVEQLWTLLRDGGVAIGEIPADRWDVDAYFDADPDAPGKMYTRRGGFLPEVDRFDPHFFGVSPREAVSMDPQQRLLLEMAWRALEDAAIAPSRLAGTQTGVFVGLSNIDYYRMAFTDSAAVDPYFGSGTSGSVAAGRISYVLGLRGPSLAVDTACSSSLVALHLACQSLRNKECGVALAGGVNLILSPDINIACSKAKMMAPDGLCKTFDARADGYVRSEGCAVVVLKRLADAERDGDRILAIVRGSAVNQDGRSSGLTVPHGPSQEAVIRRALDAAGVEPRDVTYVEAHGTGTSLGDPIEARALGRVLGDRGPGGAPLAIGSIKANIGHLEAAAGIAGLVKVVLALRHESIPGHPSLGERNPHIDWASLPLDIPTSARPWPPGDRRRIAGVSSFGFSGTNAHVVLEAAPAAVPASILVGERPAHVLTVSAKTAEALDELTGDFERFLRQTSEPLPEICATATAGRVHGPHRVAIVAATAPEAADALAMLHRGEESPRAVRRSRESAAPEVAFLFTGQGAQYAGMARGLYETHEGFRRTIDECNRLLATEMERPLLEVLFGTETELLAQTAFAQPALFAVEYALAGLWMSWGIVPAAVLGHSVGELVAACVAGVFGLEDGLRLIAARGRLMQALPDAGAMVSVFADEATVRAAIAGHERSVAIAALNAPEQIVISGARADVASIVDSLAARGITSRDLQASRAFHSPLLDPMLDAFAAAASRVAFAAPRIPIISNLTGERAAQDIATPEYWVRHARRPVRFQQGIDTLRASGVSAFLEIGPAPTLLGIARRFADAPGVAWLPSLRKGRDDWDEMLLALAALYAGGADVDWNAFDDGRRRRKVTVPGHPFRRQRYWLANDGLSGERTPLASGPVVHPLLGTRADSPLKDVIFEQRISADAPAFIRDHRVFDAVVFPATGYLEMALAAGASVGGRIPAVENLIIGEALLLPDAGDRRVQAVFTPRDDRGGVFQVFSRAATGDAAEWHLHASATIDLNGAAPAGSDALAAVRGRCTDAGSPSEHYELFARSGLDYGPSFRGITSLWRGAAEAVGAIELPGEVASEGYTLHPALLDSCFHLLLAALPGGAAAFTGQHFYLPVSIDRAAAAGPAGTRVWAHARLRPMDGERPEAFTGDVTVFDDGGAVLASIDGLTAKRATADAIRAAAQRPAASWFHRIDWIARDNSTTAPASAPSDWFVIDDGTALAAATVERLRRSGQQVRSAPAGEAAAILDGWADRGPGDAAARIVLFLTGDVAADSVADATLAGVQRASSVIGQISTLLSRIPSCGGVTVVTRGATGDTERGLLGQPLLCLASALGAEHPDTPCAAIDVETGDGPEADLLWRDLTAADSEEQIAYRGGRRVVARLERAGAETLGVPAGSQAGPTALTIAERGILDNLRLVPMSRRAPGPREVEIEIEASGLNFRDVLNALGMYPGDPGALGNECVGRVAAVGEGVTHVAVGQAVMALVHGGFQSFAVAPADWVVAVPEGMDLRAAATIPMAFTTAEYSLNRLAAMKRGERVLIHAATGGVGLAAVQLALQAGAEIFATAGSEEKRALLRSMGVRHVFNSRTVEFADAIAGATNGEGIDVVLNSLTGEAIPKSLSLLRKGGRFCEIGKRGIWSAAQVAELRPDVSYFTIFLAEVDDALIQDMLRDLAARFASGALQPLPRRVFAIRDAAAAFRHMAQARHIGKVVLAREPEVTGSPIRGNATYLITGGFGGLGLRIAEGLVESGARHLMLVGRTGLTDAARESVAALERRGVEVYAAAADVSREGDVAALFAAIAGRMPPLAGVVHAAGVRDDGLLSAYDAARTVTVLAPKVAAAWHLHRQTESIDLDFFVLFSSAASVLPSPAQGRYAAANGFLDGLARYRRTLGLPAISINWGPWDEVGMAAGLTARDQQRWARHGVTFIAPAEGVRAFARVLSARVPQIAIVAADWRKFADERPRGIPLLAALAGAKPASQGRPAATAQARGTLRDELDRVPVNRRREAILAHVREHVGQVLALEAGFVLQPHQGLRDVGMDSLMALELRNRLQRTTGQPLPATLTFDRPTVEALAAYIADDVLKIDEAAAAAAESRSAAAPLPPTVVRPEREPIAIVGIGCRLPGGANDGEAFWRLLHDGVDAIREIPSERWDVDAYFDPHPDAPGKMYVRHGGFLDKVDEFDPHFFGISPRETISLDPQQRLLLEVAWEALEDAGQAADRLFGTPSGVFVGIGTYDYALLHMKQPNPAALDAHFGTGTSLSVAAGRLSYSLGLQGPAMAIDTACSSSLVAVHLACKSLREGECRLALAGGVNLMLTPEPFVNGCRAHMLAPDGRCKTFDAAANGYVRAEGAGMIVLKRLSDAVADGDRVLAVLRGSAVNQDGRSSGLTVPHGPSQQAVIRQALDNAGVRPSDVTYVEAHGTGTALGDPIEMEALRTVMLEDRPADRPLVVGSVKTNVGHLEAAAGVAGLIKVVMSLRNEEIPANLHFTSLNPHIALGDAPIEIPTSRRAWKAGTRPRIAGISSFGFSGTNAHIIVEEAPAVAAVSSTAADRTPHVLALSAKSPEALRELAAKYSRHLSVSADALADIAFTAAAGRSHFTHRLAVTAANPAEAREALDAYLNGAAHPLAQARESAALPDVAFLFTGQGAQYAGMARELFASHATFAETLTRCDAILRAEFDLPLLDVLFADDGALASRLDQTAVTQPALFAIEYALAQLWQSWGVRPAALLGHSVGEYVAAAVAGVFSVEDGLRLIAARGRLMQSLPGGAMAAVFAPEAQVTEIVRTLAPALSVAAVNGPEHTVVSGSHEAVDAALVIFAARGIAAQRLTVSHAFHSAAMDPVLDEFERIAGRVRYQQPAVPIVSNLTGALAGPEIATAAYWRRHLREPVRFADGVSAVVRQGCGVLLEVGPKATLTGLAKRVLAPGAVTLLSSIRPPRGDWAQICETLATLYTMGAVIDWQAFDAPYARRKVSLPTYAFQRERYWLDGTGLARADRREAPAVIQVSDDRRPAPVTEVYGPDWVRVETSEDTVGVAATGRWIVIEGEDRLVGDLAAEIRKRGGTCELTAPDLLSPRNGEPTPAGIIYVADRATRSDGMGAAAAATSRLLALVRTLLQRRLEAPLWIVTHGAHRIGDDGAVAGAAVHGSLWGLARTLAVEHPELWGGAIDVDAGTHGHDVLDALAAAGDDDQIALRHGRRYVLRLRRRSSDAASFAGCRSEASYLVTGGLGMLGLEVARWLAGSGARHIVLTGRTGVPARTAWDGLAAGSDAARRVAGIRAIEAAGASVHVETVDIADQDRAAALFAKFGASLPPLRGIVHAAATMNGARLRELTAEAIGDMFRPKVGGAVVLDRLSRDADLDFFVLFSSVSALIGTADLGHYAAANSALDSLAEQRAAEGRTAVSINWGAWENLRGSERHKDVFARSGMQSMTIAAALDALGGVLASGSSRAVVASVDWKTFVPVYEARRRRPFLDLVRPEAAAAQPPAARATLRDALRSLDEDRRVEAIVEHVRETAADVLGLPARKVDPSRGFFDLGMDSLLAVELRHRLETTAGVALPATLTFKYPTVAAVAEFLALELLGAAAVPPPAAAADASATAPGDDLDLSEDELASLLASKLGQLQ